MQETVGGYIIPPNPEDKYNSLNSHQSSQLQIFGLVAFINV